MTMLAPESADSDSFADQGADPMVASPAALTGHASTRAVLGGDHDPQVASLADDDGLFAQVDSAIAAAEDLEAVAGNSDRHVSMVVLCTKLHAILVGRQAEVLLAQAEADPDSLPVEAGLWVCPSWVWMFSRIDVGRKERAYDGSRLRMPVRMQWSASPIALVEPGQELTLPWVCAGMGHTAEGEIVTRCETFAVESTQVEDESGMPDQVVLASSSRMELIGLLEDLKEEGVRARWDALLWLEPYIERALTLAHISVSTELSEQWGRRQAVLDDTKLKAIADQMLFGDDEHPGKVAQMLERCLRPDTFLRCEPVLYIKRTLRRDANSEVRRALGDPHIGAKIRRLARVLSAERGHEVGMDELIDTYRERYPNDRLSRDRAEAAMSVRPDAMASWFDITSATQD